MKVILFYIVFNSVFVMQLYSQSFKTKKDIVLYFMNLDTVQKFLQKGECSNFDNQLFIADTQKVLRKYGFNKLKWGNCYITIVDSGKTLDSLKDLPRKDEYWKRFCYYYFLSFYKNLIVIQIPYKSRACVLYFRKKRGGYYIYRREFDDGI